jgi:thioredoxin reductase
MQYDAAVIGGSFAGLSAAMQLARARRKVLIIDAGLPRNRFAKTSHGFLGQDGRTPQEIVDIGRSQLLAYPTAQIVHAEASAVDQSEQAFSIELSNGQQISAARLVLATGVKDELPQIAGLEDRWGATVLHCPYCHGYEVADRRIGVLGSGPGSIHQAALVADWGPVTLFTMGVVQPSPEDLALLAKRNVQIENAPVVELVGAAPEMEAVRLQDGRVLPLGALFLMPRTRFVSDLALRLGCATEEGPMGPYLKVDERKQTSVANLFAAGDVAAPMPNATLAAAAGVLAGGAAHQSLIFG